eukprot:TRINITY_DN5771_c1_g1_i3.p1 TRINITY_DN5771_c1_g1~~TRINITY_DN5771_c1_g1_i3.p1  ORF type:complete len:205 (+),score=71.32 TRINITY_DN5771_c1_g1_i3:48-662(+)
MGALPSVRQAVLGGTVLLLCAAVKASTLVRVVDAESPVPPRAERRPLATPPPPKPPPLPPPPPPAPSPPPQRLRRPLRLLPFGDSVTRGFCDERHFSYRRPLWGLLREAGLAASVEFVGHQRQCFPPPPPGDRPPKPPPWGPHAAEIGATTEILQRVLREALDRLAGSLPDVAVVYAGINDAFASKIRFPVIIGNIRKLVEMLQ